MGHVLALTTTEQIQLAIAGITALAALTALANVAVNVLNERRRGQPIVIAHEERERHFSSSALVPAWVVDSYITAEGGGPAFNVRFGVEFSGVRYPYRLSIDDPESGNVQRVLRSGERRPEKASWPILIDSVSMWGRAAESGGDLDAKRIYWARYENAQGNTWETRNPGDRSARLDIRRVRWVKRRERREQQRREKAGQHDEAWVGQALDELRAETERRSEPRAE
jgi:hypothetical protein